MRSNYVIQVDGLRNTSLFLSDIYAFFSSFFFSSSFSSLNLLYTLLDYKKSSRPTDGILGDYPTRIVENYLLGSGLSYVHAIRISQRRKKG